jgi:predicted DNA-binding transcriptional regulator YafY
VSRRHQIQRQWEIVRYLEAGGALTLADLAELIRPSDDRSDGRAGSGEGGPRRWSQGTIRRDLEDLIQAGFPILKQEQGGVRWRFPEGYRNTIPGPFPLSELMALYYARRVFDAFRETPFRRTFQSFLITLEKLLPAPVRDFLDRLDQHFGPYLPAVKSLALHQEVLEEMTRAADERRCVEVRVLPSGRRRASWRRMDPYGVWHQLGRTLLMGYLHETRSLELLPLESIREVRATKDVFQLPLDIDFQSVLTGRLAGPSGAPSPGGEVLVRCSGDAVERVREAIERGWLPGISLESPEPSGRAGDPAGSGSGEEGASLVRLSASDLNSIRAWVLSLGGGAEVVSPEELRRAVARELREAQGHYRPESRREEPKPGESGG